MMLTIFKFVLGAGLLAGWLHHGWAHYDTDRAFTLEGTIQKVQYVNPHVLIQVQPNSDSTVSWLAVLAPPLRMTRRGLPEDSVRVGRTASMDGYPHREHPDEMRAERITIGNRVTELR